MTGLNMMRMIGRWKISRVFLHCGEADDVGYGVADDDDFYSLTSIRCAVNTSPKCELEPQPGRPYNTAR